MLLVRYVLYVFVFQLCKHWTFFRCNCLDAGTYRYDPLVSLDGTCPEPQGASNPDSDCPNDIRMLCNGVMNCDNCADEVYETCMAYDCSISMVTIIFTSSASHELLYCSFQTTQDAVTSRVSALKCWVGVTEFRIAWMDGMRVKNDVRPPLSKSDTLTTQVKSKYDPRNFYPSSFLSLFSFCIHVGGCWISEYRRDWRVRPNLLLFFVWRPKLSSKSRSHHGPICEVYVNKLQRLFDVIIGLLIIFLS